MKRWFSGVLFLWLLAYACTSRPLFIQECFLESDSSLAQGTLLVTTETSDGRVLWQTLELSTGQLRPYDILNTPIILEDERVLLPPSCACDVKISPDGRMIAYQTYLQEEGYIIYDQDGDTTIFAANEVVLVYSPESREWFITESDARIVNPRYYPLIPSGNEEKLQHIILESLDDKKVAANWVAEYGKRSTTTLVVISSDGKDLRYFPNWHNEWQSFEGWLNAEDLELTNYVGANLLERFARLTLKSDQKILLDWQTGEKVVSGDNLPDKYFLSWAPAYSPSKRYVAYRGKKNLVIFDRTKHEIALQTPLTVNTPYTPPGAPVWIGESYLVVASQDDETGTSDLFILSIKGEQIKFHLDRQVLSEFLLQESTKFISFWVAEERNNKLLFLDAEKGHMYDFCLAVDQGLDVGARWLPTPGHFALSVYHGDKTEIIILDVLRQRIFKTINPFIATISG